MLSININVRMSCYNQLQHSINNYSLRYNYFLPPHLTPRCSLSSLGLNIASYNCSTPATSSSVLSSYPAVLHSYKSLFDWTSAELNTILASHWLTGLLNTEYWLLIGRRNAAGICWFFVLFKVVLDCFKRLTGQPGVIIKIF